MNRLRKSIVFIALVFISVQKCFAWGPEGHTIVCKLALQFVRDDVRQNVLKVLAGMPLDTAANWMDIMKGNADYDFMRTWHYIDFQKDKGYIPSIDDNLINRLTLTCNELKHKNVLCDQQIQTDVLILFHLMGDLHMPLHTGYDDDLGGNTRMVQYDTLKTHNLHRFWDEDIIKFSQITYDNCLTLYNSEKGLIDTGKIVDFITWMNGSRGLLDQVYDLQDGYIVTDHYLQRANLIVKKQLLLGGIRLARILEKLFYSPAAVVDFKELTTKAKKGIDIQEAINYVGKEVTICEHVYSVRETPAITQISVGGKYPNNPLTIVIFGKSYQNFTVPLGEAYRDKNICVKGKIEVYKGKPQIIVEGPKDITVYQ